MDEGWKERSETSNQFWLNLLWQTTRLAGRRACRIVLLPVIALVYLCFDRESRRHSLDFLRRVGPDAPTWWQVFRHLLTFATVSVDRLHLLAGDQSQFEVRTTGDEVFARLGGGALLVTAHFGSFEVMRVLGTESHKLDLHILLDKSHNAAAYSLISALNPPLAERVIDAGIDGPRLVVQLANVVQAGGLVGLMGDRLLPGQRHVECDFLGAPAAFPLGPWILAGIIDCPVICCFGIFEGGATYRLQFEQLDVRDFSGGRQEQAQAAASAYAAMLGRYVKMAPYNWFNFFDFWATHDAPPRTRGD